MNKNHLFLKNYILYVLIALYIVLNLTYLTKFPFVHSDESWLSGLSRNIMEKGDYSVTETFFDLKERHPHAIKLIFHTIQILFIKLMGYHIFTFRFISLCFGLLTLYFSYKLGCEIFGSNRTALTAASLLAADVQFIYASHFARQEIIILFMLILGLWVKFRYIEQHALKCDILLGIIIGLSIGIHPNSFIISLPFGLIYLYEVLISKERKFSGLAAYVITVACFAAFFVALSLYFDPNFITNYSKYGNEFEVFNPLSSKISEVKEFYLKLFYRVSGTYYTPDIRFQFFLFPVVLVLSIIKSAVYKNNKKILYIILSIAAINAGIVLIGRFNQTSAVFMFPLFYLLTAYILENLQHSCRRSAVALLLVVLAGFTAANYLEYKDNSYSTYLKEIASVVKPSDETLGNLNSEYHFENGKLHDYRNLAFLKAKGMNFAEYIRSNNIKYIIYSEELDLIHELKPKWDGIYGPTGYYDEMKAFIKSNCELVHQFSDSYYGIRIVRYMGIKKWQVRIYRVSSKEYTFS